MCAKYGTKVLLFFELHKYSYIFLHFYAIFPPFMPGLEKKRAHACVFQNNFVTLQPILEKYVFYILCLALLTACNKPSKVEQYRAEKHVRDSVSLVEQQRSLAYYEEQMELLTQQADSLLPLFNYEKNEKYQDNGFYVVKIEKLKVKVYDLRVMVRDDGKEMLVYRSGKRLTSDQANAIKNAHEALQRAQHLQIVMHDLKELENRIARTSLEIQKYQKRL